MTRLSSGCWPDRAWDSVEWAIGCLESVVSGTYPGGTVIWLSAYATTRARRRG